MSEAQDILIQLRHLGLKDQQIADVVGVHRVSINGIRNGSGKRNTGSTILEPLRELLTEARKPSQPVEQKRTMHVARSQPASQSLHTSQQSFEASTSNGAILDTPIKNTIRYSLPDEDHQTELEEEYEQQEYENEAEGFSLLEWVTNHPLIICGTFIAICFIAGMRANKRQLSSPVLSVALQSPQVTSITDVTPRSHIREAPKQRVQQPVRSIPCFHCFANPGLATFQVRLINGNMAYMHESCANMARMRKEII